MPIRINLLAEQLTAEEMRRRDPVKRALYIGVALVLIMLLWIGLTEVNLALSRKELAGYESELKQVDDQSKLVKSNHAAATDIEAKIKALDRYQRSRFFWGTFLDAIQQVTVDNVRLVEIKAEHREMAGDVGKLFNTTVTVPMTVRPPSWKFWASAAKQPQLPTLVSNALSTVTNKAPFTTNHLEYAIKMTPTTTNLNIGKVTVKLEFTSMPWTSEQITVDLRGRDYGTPLGAAVDEFARRMSSSDYFKELMAATDGLRFTERPPQPRTEAGDPINPNAPFVPFTIQLGLKERMFSNE